MFLCLFPRYFYLCFTMKSEFFFETPRGQFAIRLIEPGDSPFIKEIIVNTLLEFGASGDGFACNDAETQNMYSHYQADGRIYFVVVRTTDQKVVGGGGVAPLKDYTEVCEFVKMYYLPDIRGLGLGKRLLEICIEEAKKMGYKKMYLETLERMTAARALYEKYGFVQTEEPFGATGHFSCDAFYIKAFAVKF